MLLFFSLDTKLVFPVWDLDLGKKTNLLCWILVSYIGIVRKWMLDREERKGVYRKKIAFWINLEIMHTNSSVYQLWIYFSQCSASSITSNTTYKDDLYPIKWCNLIWTSYYCWSWNNEFCQSAENNHCK